MPNQHKNTEQVRIPMRAAEGLRLLAKHRQLTKSTTIDQIVMDTLRRDGHQDILDAIAVFPEPRGSLPPGVAVGTAPLAE